MTAAQPLLLKPEPTPAAEAEPRLTADWKGIPGLSYQPGFLTPDQQQAALERIAAAAEEWRNDLRRRVQHYGWRYDYKAKAITPDHYLGLLPDWLQELAERLYRETGLFDRIPEQVIVNEYLPGQGITMHIDHHGFGPTVATLTLGDPWEMDFSANWQDKKPERLDLGSALLMTGPARSQWQHGIRPEKRDRDGRPRQRRVSLTFRTVLNRDGSND